MDPRLDALLADQSGTVARQQLRALDFPEHEIRRLLHRRDLASVHRGVYVAHTGSPTWIERAWAAVLATSKFGDGGFPKDSALAGESALRIVEGPGSGFAESRPLQVVVPASRDLSSVDGVVIGRYRRFAEQVTRWRGLPCVRYEEALIDALGDLGRWESFARVANAVGARRTTPDRVRAAAEGRPWMHER